MFRKLFSLSNGALFVALALSTIAAWYSIVGLTAIFAGAVVPIIIMGSALELAKITTTVWLRKYWHRASLLYKIYLVPAVVALALLTSMGIFGFLSKAHLDQNIGSGDIQAQVSLFDEKIATQRETIKSSKAALTQMDQQVNDIMTKGDSEKAVERSVMIRKQQQKERASLMKDIEVANKEIQKLNEERAPIASELRKVEAEVGPIKYIAALIYGDNPDANVLERAVRWVIILLVVVFDPLAIMLVLAANQSKDWDTNDDVDEENKLREQVEHEKQIETILEEVPVVEEPVILEVTSEEEEAFKALEPKPEPEKTMAELHPYLNQPFSHFTDTQPIVYKPEVEEPAYEPDDGPLTDEQIEQLKKSVELFKPQGSIITKDSLFPDITLPVEETVEVATKPLEGEEALQVLKDIGIVTEDNKLTPEYGGEEVADDGVDEEKFLEQFDENLANGHVVDTKILTMGIDEVERPGDYITEPTVDTSPTFEGVKVGDEWIQTGPAFEKPPTVAVSPLSSTPFKKLAGGYVEFEGKRMHERVLRDTRPDLFLKEDNPRDIAVDFGTETPNTGNLGDMFIRTDVLPHQVFKFNGTKWVGINKEVSGSYLSNTNYLQHLMDKISTGEYDPELLTEFEQDAITALIKR